MVRRPTAIGPFPPLGALFGSADVKPPPSDPDVESDLVGAILVDPDVLPRVIDLVAPEDFSRSNYREIYEIALALDAADEVPDVTTVAGELRRRGSAIDPLSIRDIAAQAPTAPTLTAPRRARTLARLAAQRQLMSRLAEGLEESGADGADPAEIAANLAGDVLDITAKRGVEVKPFGDLVVRALEDLEQEAIGNIQPAALTGFRGVDAKIGGLRHGWLTLVAARPGVGKTSFAAAIARNVAARKRVLLFSLEMSADELAMRILCSEAGVDFSAVRRGAATLADWGLLVEGVELLADLPLRVVDSPGITLAEIRAMVRREKDVGLVVVDYLQLMTAGRRRPDNRQQEVSEISRGLKLLAREVELPILACCQLNREVDKRADARPKLSDLRESGSLEQDSDVVILLHREANDPRRVEAIIAKHRSGPTGSVKLSFEHEYTRFRDQEGP